MESEQFICPICHESSDLPTFKLPECQHEFHCECIIHWFRAGNSKCPMCNNPGHINNRDDNFLSYRYNFKYKSNFLRRYSLRKDCDPILKNYVVKIRKYENKLKELNLEFKENKDSFTGTYKDFTKLKGNYTTRRRNIQQNINNIKREMCEYPINELIIVRKITLMDD
tara:strand:- start:501 stop:1004 length:504 start_codon:yes stop_codon:yes gene_type:complete